MFVLRSRYEQLVKERFEDMHRHMQAVGRLERTIEDLKLQNSDAKATIFSRDRRIVDLIDERDAANAKAEQLLAEQAAYSERLREAFDAFPWILNSPSAIAELIELAGRRRTEIDFTVS